MNANTTHAWRLSAVSGLPLPGEGGISPPTDTAPWRVLDWAGYEGAVSFTFDDTQPSQMEHWAEIEATGVRATWYLAPVYRQNAGFEKTWAAVRAAGHEIGGHTEHHYYVSQLAAHFPSLTTAEAAAQELDSCDGYIRSVIGQSAVWTMAYPYGDTAWKPYLGGRYLFARTVSDGVVTPDENLDVLMLPTYTVQAGDTRRVFESKIDEAAALKGWKTLLFHSLTPTDQNWYAGVRAKDVVASLQYGKDGDRVWLDSVVNVGAYWMAAKLLRAAVPVEAGGTKTWSWTVPSRFPPGRFLRIAGSGRFSQNNVELPWNDHGFYEVAIDAGALTWRP